MPTTRLPSRRRTLALLGALAAAAATPASAQDRKAMAATPEDAEGPFYPRRFPDDADADLTRVAGRTGSAKGTLLYLSGQVLAANGRPLPQTRIELWQCDALGRYHHVDGDPGELDPDFQGFGIAIADADGRYAFRTIRPVRYGGRPPHLHFKLAQSTARPLTTQLYPRGESAERSVGFGLSGRETRAQLEFAMAPAAGREPGALAATYDFVLRMR